MGLRILLVEDSRVQGLFIQQFLREMTSAVPFEVAWVETMAAALNHLDGASTDLVLLDLVLPDSSGIETFEVLHAAHGDLPIIVLSGAGDESTALRAVTEGAQDFITKSNLSPELLARSIRYAIERHNTLEAVRRLALVDELTGVYNRRGFLFVAEQQLSLARREARSITVLFLDVDGLKEVNDQHGHEKGDRALRDVANVMRATFRTSDVLARVGGDEFCALLLEEESEPDAVAQRLRAAIASREPCHPFRLSCSIGAIREGVTEQTTVAGLMARSDDAMYAERLSTRRRHAVQPDRPAPTGDMLVQLDEIRGGG